MNVVLISIDTLRSDHLSGYGYKRQTSPSLDALAEEGALFPNFYSQCHWTIPTFTSIFTGLWPINHEMTWLNALGEIGRADAMLDEKIPVLPELLWDAGFVTAAIDNLQAFCHFPNWFNRGYEYYINTIGRSGHGAARVTADMVNAHLLPWIEQHHGKPFFLHVHYWDPHLPFNQPEPFDTMWMGQTDDEGLRIKTAVTGEEYVDRCGKRADLTDAEREHVARYDGEISYADDRIGQFVARLKELGVYDDTLIVVTGDHGEVMFEISPKGHHSIYEPLLRVPLILKLPGETPAVQRPEGLAQQIDIMPTILDCAGVEPRGEMDGRSLMPLIRGEEERVHDELYHVGNRMCGIRCRAIRTEQWKLIVNYVGYEWAQPMSHPEAISAVPARELFDTQKDPEELQNLVDEHPDVAVDLERKLARWIESNVGTYLNDPLLRRY